MRGGNKLLQRSASALLPRIGSPASTAASAAAARLLASADAQSAHKPNGTTSCYFDTKTRKSRFLTTPTQREHFAAVFRDNKADLVVINILD